MTSGNNRKLLLHSCCAGCSIKAVEELKTEGDVLLYYDNSNIHPRSEWMARLNALKKVAGDMELKLIVADWSPRKWFETVGGDPSNKNLRRCSTCWEMRLNETAKKAAELGIEAISTTLLSSRYQSRDDIGKIGHSVANTYGLTWISFTTDNSVINISDPKGFYRQNYCGCVFSLAERMEEKWGRD